jgi:hypothetical protein
MGGLIKRYIFPLFLVMLLMSADNLMAQSSPGSEIGDAIFRPLMWHFVPLPILEHVALYRNSYGGAYWWEPGENMENSNFEHSAIQASGEGKVVSHVGYDVFLSGMQQTMKGYSKDSIPTSKRLDILQAARSQYGAWYPKYPDDCHWPYIMFTREQAQAQGDTLYPNGSFRCDGLVEWSYDQVDGVGGVFSEEEVKDCFIRVFPNTYPPPLYYVFFPTFHPNALRRRMSPENPQPPNIEIIQPQDGFVVEDSVGMEFTTEDQPIGCGSGIDKVEILIDNVLKHLDDEDCDGEKQVSYTWDASDASYGFHYITIKSYDRAGNLAEERIKVYKGDAPFVVSTVPYDGAQDVAIDTTISITFSAVMDQMTTSGAVSIEPPVSFTPFWWSPDGMTLDLDLNDNLDYCQEYTVTITDDAMSKDSIHLDGDGNGEPGGDYVFSFTTEKPEIVVDAYPEVKHIEERGSATHHVVSKGNQLKDSVDCRIEFEVNNPGGWNVSGADDEDFPLFPGGTHANTYTSTNMGATAALDVFYQVGAKCALIEGEGYYWCAQGHMHDHPDENQSPGEMNYPTPWICRTRGDSINPGLPDIGIMLSGWADGYGHILGKYNISTLPVKPNFKIINHPDMLVSDSVKLLVVGSAGLKGQNSQLLAQKLEEYVTSGGNLLVLTQKFGSDLSVLPGGIDGYGWSEDQACFRNAAYLNQWHSVFSGQVKQVMSCNVDGYITQYPDYADVLLRRTANGMPALLSYNYGAGTVIISSLYPDWGYGHNQTSEEELRLLRDITTWAMNPEMSIPEFYLDSVVNVPVSIRYTTDDTVEATTAIVKVFIPDRNLYDSVAVSVSLQPGEEIQWDWDESSLPQHLGLWVIDYALMDNNNDWIQGYNRGAIFSQRVDVSTGDYNLGDFQIWANSDKEEILPGDTVTYEIFVRNNTDSSFTGNVVVGVHEEGGKWWQIVDLISNLTIPSDTVVKTVYKRPLWISTSTYFGLYSDNQLGYGHFFRNALARCQKGVWLESQPFPVSLSLDKNHYIWREDAVHYSVKVENKTAYPCSVRVEQYTILDLIRYNIRIDTISLSSSSFTVVEGGFFPFDYDSTALGKQVLGCDVYYRDALWSSVSKFYNIVYPDVLCSLALPDSFYYNGSNPYTVTLGSEGDYLPPGKLLVTGKDYFNSLTINWSSIPETTLTLDYQPDEWWLNDWVKAEYRFGDQRSSIKENLPFAFPQCCYLIPKYFWGKGHGFMSYKWAEFITKVKGRGKVIGAPFSVWLYTCPPNGDTLRDTVIVNPDSVSHILVSTYIDTILDPDKFYGYSFGYEYLNKEEIFQVVRGGYKVRRPQICLAGTFCRDTFHTTERIPIGFGNSHLQTTSISIDSFRLFGNGVSTTEPGPGVVEVPKESIVYPCSLDVPEWVSGEYRMSVFAETMEEGWRMRGVGGTDGYPFFINGIESQLAVDSKKDWYQQNEDKIFSSLIQNGEVGYSAVETLSVYPFAEEAFTCTLDFPFDTTFLYGIEIGDSAFTIAPSYSLHSIEWYSLPGKGRDDFLPGYDRGGSFPFVDPQGNVWVVDGWSKTFSKYNHNFSELLDTFTLPDSVGNISGAALKDGWIYAIDSDNGLIRKINSISGELINSWGELMYPRGITINQGGNLLVVDDGTKNLWEFSETGDSISTYQLPTTHYYLDIDHYNGKTYLCCNDKIITLQEGIIDSFEVSGPVMDYISLRVSKEGKIVVNWANEYERVCITLFNSLEEEEATTVVEGEEWIETITFDGEDILCFGYGYVTAYREFGVDKGMILYDEEMFESIGIYTFLDYHPIEELGTGFITYEGFHRSIREGGSSLDQFKGTHHLPDIAVTLMGDSEYPKYMGLALGLSILSRDSVVQQFVHNPTLSPYEDWTSNDTITDSLYAGDYAVIGDLYTEASQLVNSDIDYFTVIGDEVALLMHPDTNDVPVGWTFHPNIQVINPLPDSQENLHLTLQTSDSMYLDTIFTMDSSKVDSFPISLNPMSPIVLSGELILPGNDTINKDITLNVIGGIISLAVSAPDIVGLEPFILQSELENYSVIPQDVILKRRWGSDSLIDTVLVSPGNSVMLLDSLSITKEETLKVVATGGFGEESKELPVDFGIRGDITLDTLYRVAPDFVEMEGVVRNNGVYPVNLMALFCLVEDTLGRGIMPLQSGKGFDESNPYNKKIVGEVSEPRNRDLEVPPTNRDRDVAPTTEKAVPFPYNQSARSLEAIHELPLQRDIKRVGKEISFEEFVEEIVRADIDTSLSYLYLSPGEVDTIPIMFDFHNPGDYLIIGYLFTETLSVFLDSSSSSVNVVEEALVSIDSMILSPHCDSTGSVPLLVLLGNESYNSFFGSLTLSSSLCYLDTTVDISPQLQDTIVFLLDEPVDEGEYTVTASLKEGGVALDEKQTEIHFKPLYQLDSIPEGLSVSVGDTGSISLQVSNIGNGRGERRISAQWVDVINLIQDEIINPGSLAVFTRDFFIPLDMPGGCYYCNVSILNGSYPEVDTFFPVIINGVSIAARDSLDKMVYQIGDTADFSILIENESMWSGYLDASIQYGDFSSDTSFILGGMEKGVCNESFPRDTLYLDTSGIYMFDPFYTKDYDSLEIQWNLSSDSLSIGFRTDSSIGRGNWNTIETGMIYPVDGWSQLRIINELPDTEWVNSIVLIFYPQDTLYLDTFPLQREVVGFDVLVSETNARASWGIYHPSGRSIVLDERYIYLEDDSLTIFTDKARYELLDTVNATLYKHFPGTNYDFHYWVYFSPTEIIEDSFALIEDTMEFALLVPEWTRSGSYSIDWWVMDITGKENSKIRSEVDRYDMKNKVGRSEDVHTVQPPSFFNRGQKPAPTDGAKLVETIHELPLLQESRDWGVAPTRGQDISCPYRSREIEIPLAKQWVLGKVEPERNDSAIIEGSHPFDVNGITIYFKNTMMDTNWYLIRDTAKVWMDISSDIDINCELIISSTGSVVDTHSLSLNKDIPNYYELKYPITGCDRGMNELYLHLLKDSMSLAGEVLYFDVYIPDSIPPMISIIEEPSNTYSSSQLYKVRARIWNPDSSNTPFYDTLYYRISSVGGADWQSLLTHSVRGDTHQYHIPSQPNGSWIQFHIAVRDSFGNLVRYPEEGERDFWVLSPMKPSWSELTYTRDTTAALYWNPPGEQISYHCGLHSDTILLNDKIVATRFIPEYLPARMEKIGVELINEDTVSSMDTIVVHLYEVLDSLPGVEMDSSIFTDTLDGYEEFNLPGIEVPSEGIFIGMSSSSELGVILDGFGKGTHTAVYSEGQWSLYTSGEVLMDGFLSYLPSVKKRQSEILSFALLRASGDTNWMSIASGISDTSFIDTTVMENRGYSYKIEASFSNPADTFFSNPWSIFIDLTIPILDTVILSSSGDTILISATLIDTSKIYWDSLGYKRNDSLFVIPEDSCSGNNHFFSIYFTEDTLQYYLIVSDSSLIGNIGRYPETGFYQWVKYSGVTEKEYPEETFLANIGENPIIRNTEVRYGLARGGNVRIVLYDVLGRVAKTLINRKQERGYYSIPLDIGQMPQGVFFLRMRVGDYERTLKLVKLL